MLMRMLMRMSIWCFPVCFKVLTDPNRIYLTNKNMIGILIALSQ